MTLRLILMRHAKSAWDTGASGDYDRPLNERGRGAADLIGGWLADNNYLPDKALVSAAARTRETWKLASANFSAAPKADFFENLYLASPESMFQMIRAISGSPTLMMVAHNPGSAIVASALARTPYPHPRFDDYPSAATAIIEFDISSWGDLTPETGNVVDFIVPRDLLTDEQ